jgi:hypothetical protein
LDDGIHGINEGLLDIGHGDRETSRTGELNQSHTNRIRPEDEVGCQSDSKLNFHNEVGWQNRTRFIKDEHNIHQSVACLSGTIPAGDNGKGIAVKGKEIDKVNSHSRGIIGSARKTSGRGCPNNTDRIISIRNGISSASEAINCFLSAGSHQSIAIISRNFGRPSLCITSSTAV